MTKQNKLFSWLGFGKKTEAETVETAAEQQVQLKEQQTDTQLDTVQAAEVTEAEAPVETTEVVEVTPELIKAELTTTAAIVPVSTLQPQPAERPGFFARLK